MESLSQIDNTSLYGAHVLQGVCRSRHGTFPADYVRNLDGQPPPRQLGSPFNPGHRRSVPETTLIAARTTVAGALQDDELGARPMENSRARARSRHAHVSDEEQHNDGNVGVTW